MGTSSATKFCTRRHLRGGVVRPAQGGAREGVHVQVQVQVQVGLTESTAALVTFLKKQGVSVEVQPVSVEQERWVEPLPHTRGTLNPLKEWNLSLPR